MSANQTAGTVLSLENKRKMLFFFVFCSLIRTFATEIEKL